MIDLLNVSSSLKDAVQAIEESKKRIAVVVDKYGMLVGTVTDGDIRRALLNGATLDSNVVNAMNASPKSCDVGTSDGYILGLLIQNNLEAIPLVDKNGKYQRVVHVSELSTDDKHIGGAEGYGAAVIMAGGEGTRLRPFTEDTPKPMLDVGGMPLLERLVKSLVKAGIKKIFISTNYLGHTIEEYFKDGSCFDASINYLKEDKKLGTAGALSLLPDLDKKPILVMNGDILTGSDYRNLLIFHNEHNVDMTVCAVEYHIEIPYGVLKTNGIKATSLEEKPSQRFLCNAGIYVLSCNVLEQIPVNSFYNMTQLIELYTNNQKGVAVFPLHEYWTDIGTPDDLERARKDVINMDIINA